MPGDLGLVGEDGGRPTAFRWPMVRRVGDGGIFGGSALLGCVAAAAAVQLQVSSSRGESLLA